jgi:hypothetical protein
MAGTVGRGLHSRAAADSSGLIAEMFALSTGL